ncbi:hypothetical protein BJF95_15490 [Rhizobium oryziradicis]|uniref:Uncharacterized protein n=1 Tax=Rhizobium oryziradicis TaxID=1867956 RepID=A0A1Q8ZXL4_9HYPH|nr:hypothetical protein BJF95_15490 [Rhizobium oryziradicis]
MDTKVYKVNRLISFINLFRERILRDNPHPHKILCPSSPVKHTIIVHAIYTEISTIFTKTLHQPHR